MTRDKQTGAVSAIGSPGQRDPGAAADPAAARPQGQPAVQKGNDNYVYGQFIQSCASGGVPGPNPSSAPGPYIIQLYDDPSSGDS